MLYRNLHLYRLRWSFNRKKKFDCFHSRTFQQCFNIKLSTHKLGGKCWFFPSLRDKQ